MRNSSALLLATMLALLNSVRSCTSLSSALYRPFPAFVAPFSGSSRQRWIETSPFIHPIPTTTNKRLSSSLAAALRDGDSVRVALKNKTTIQGLVNEVRGSGWYEVQVSSSNDSLKVRGNQISLVESSPSISSNETTTTAAQSDPTTMPPPPTIVDIDAALRHMDADTIQNKQELQYLHQCAHHASLQKWVVFTDLHCSPSSLDTCLVVLKKAHNEALERNAGVLFLGDFWHHRANIRIDVLNAILESLRDWKVPMILIPGNHDQITLGGHNHGLRPLENAYRVEYQDYDGKTQSVPGPLVFTYPTKLRKALFIPHIRNGTIMESVLRSESALKSTALFVHADVTGAYMNDLIVSQGGVSPSWFPPSTLIYSGHFHKPHQVTSGNVCIQYIGSPYETSLAEAGQQKSLLVLDAADWSCVERIPLDIGRKHFSATSLEELLALNVAGGNSIGTLKSGDRGVVTIQKDKLEEMRRAGDVRFDKQIKAIRQLGAVVEVREIASQAVGPMQLMLEEMTPQTTLSAFFQEQIRRESTTKTTAEQLLKAGLLLLEDLELEHESTMMNPSGTMTYLTLESVTLQGFGPFKHKVTYPLNNRGLVLVRGINKDGGADSNGSGKSSLAMAPLWALTGTLDPRPTQDAKVADVVNDESKSARVSVRGKINGEPFVVTRTKMSSKGTLVFHLNEKDLTTQSIKETQAVIDEKLGVGSQIVARTMFHGQHSMNGLLEATDAKFKEELSLVVPLSLWQQGTMRARAKSREASQKAAEVGGMISLRSSDLGESIQRRDEAKARVVAQQASFEHIEFLFKEELRELRESIGSPNVDIQGVHNSLEAASVTVQELELQLKTLVVDRDANVAQLHAHSDESTMCVSLKRDEFESKCREYDRALLKVESIQSKIKELEKKWNLDISNGIADLVPPDICPTCQQPISDSGEGHSREDLQQIVQDEVNGVVQHLFAAEVAMQEAIYARESAAADLDVEEKLLHESHVALQEVRSLWTGKVKSVEKDLAKARKEQSALSKQLSNAALAMQQESIIKTKEAAFAYEQRAVETCVAVHENLCKAVEEAEVQLQDLQRSGDAQLNLSAQMTNLADAFGARGVQTFVLQNAIETLQTISQAYLDELSDGSQRLELSLDTGDRISRKAMVRSPGGGFVERPLSSLSGGQWRRCSLALSLGFADLVARRGRLKTSLCVLDEPLTHLDRSGRSSVGHLLRSLLRQGERSGLSNSMSVSTILLILQDLAAEELEESFDRIDEVTKVDGLSFVSVDEQS